MENLQTVITTAAGPEPARESRPGSRRLRIVAMLFGCVLMALITGCGMKTDLKLDGNFKGERVITTEEIPDQNIPFVTSFKVTDAEAVLKAKCPPEMKFECKYTNEKKTKAKFIFTVSFTSLEDYRAKVKALIGRDPSVQFVYKDPKTELFNSGFSIAEDFESKDLIAWVKPALKEGMNASKDVSSMTDDVDIIMNGVTYDNDNFGSAKVKLNTIAKYQLEKIEIRTIHDVSQDGSDYEREITVYVPKKTYEAIGKSNIQTYIESIIGSSAKGKWLSDDGSTGRYRISFKGSAEAMDTFMKSVFGSSCSFGYVSDGSLNTAFSETGVLSEKIDFSKFPCRSDGTCDATVTYINRDGSKFDAAKSTLSGQGKKKSDEGLSEDGKTVVLIYEKASTADVRLYSSSLYEVSKVCVTTDISGDDRIAQAITIAYKVDEDDSGAQFAAKYFNKSLEGSGFEITVGSFNDSQSQYAVVITTPRGTAEEVTALLQKYIGKGNSIEISGEDSFTLYNKRKVTVKVDVASFIKPSKYEGEIIYGFTGAGEVSSASWTSASAGKNDLLMGETKSEFEYPISVHTFTVSYSIRRLNVMFALLAGALIIVVVGVIFIFLGWLALRRKRKREEQKLEAVMTMALVTLPDGSETMMEVTPEEAANAVVIAPKNDDGLDEDDDDPENVWLFSTAMRLFTAMAGVLFFFSFFKVGYERNWLELLDSDKGISGYDLLMGTTINDRQIDGSYFNAVLVVIPIVIFIIISFRNMLPKLVANLSIVGFSLFQVWYLLSLSDSVSAQVDMLGIDGKQFFMTESWAYNYSIVIYILMFAAAVILTLVDAGISIKRGFRRRHGE